VTTEDGNTSFLPKGRNGESRPLRHARGYNNEVLGTESLAVRPVRFQVDTTALTLSLSNFEPFTGSTDSAFYDRDALGVLLMRPPSNQLARQVGASSFLFLRSTCSWWNSYRRRRWYTGCLRSNTEYILNSSGIGLFLRRGIGRPRRCSLYIRLWGTSSPRKRSFPVRPDLRRHDPES